MKRGGPLKRKTQLRARSPLRRPRPRRKRPIAEVVEAWQAAREAIYLRAGGRCERCGSSLDTNGMDAHHRKLRSRGGTDELSNLAALCPSCHRSVHANPAAATDAGWMIRTRTDPTAVHVILWNGRPVRLDNSGT